MPAPNRKQTRSGRFYDIDGCGTFPSVTTILSCINKPALMNWAAKVERELVVKVAADLYEDTAGTPKMARTAYTLTINNRLGKEKAHQKELAKAGEIGTQCHALIEWTLRGMLMYEVGPSPRITDKAQWAFMAWEDFKKAVELKPISVEQIVWSQNYGYAGTMDLLCEVDLNGLIRFFRKKGMEIPNIIADLASKQTHALTVADWKTGKAVYSEAHLQNAAYRQAVREMGHGDPELGLIVRLPKVETDPEFEIVIAKPESTMFPKFLDTMSVWTWCQEMEAEYQEKQNRATPENEIEGALKESVAQRS